MAVYVDGTAVCIGDRVRGPLPGVLDSVEGIVTQIFPESHEGTIEYIWPFCPPGKGHVIVTIADGRVELERFSKMADAPGGSQ